jgi:DNA-binding response OmpR family regulator
MVKHSILIVDDDNATVGFLEILFMGRGYGVICATSGAQGIELARRHHPDLVMIDVMMADMNGYAVCQQLRADPITAEIPIVILTARNSLADKATGYESGANRFLVKPVAITRLAEIVDELTSQKASSVMPPTD